MFQETLQLLSTMINAPLNIQRYSTRQFFQFLRHEEKFPLSREEFEKFLSILKSADEANDKRCITNPVPASAKASDYGSLKDFLKKHCSSAVRSDLAKLVLSAAKIFIEAHPASPWHEFVMLRQLRDTLKFSGSSNYEERIIACEQIAFRKIIEIQRLLENKQVPIQSRVDQALSCLSAQKASLDDKKAALLILACYHVSHASIYNGQFNMLEHNKKNFQLLFAISRVSEVNEVSHISFSGNLANDNFFVQKLEDDRLQSITLTINNSNASVTLMQPKKLTLYWEVFFQRLRGESDPVALMTTILKEYYEKYHNKNGENPKGNLLAWFEVIQASYEEDWLKTSYAELYVFLQQERLLPENAPEPIVSVHADNIVQLSSKNERTTSGMKRPLSSTISSGNSTDFKRRAGTNQFARTSLSVITEGSEDEKSPQKTTDKREEYSASQIDSLQYLATNDDSGNMHKTDDDSYDPEEDDQLEDFLPSHSQFAQNFFHIMGIAYVYQENGSRKKLAETLKSIITTVLDWVNEAPCQVPVPTTLNKLKNCHEKFEITLNELYVSLYTVFYSVVISSSTMQLLGKKTLSYYRDASAILMLLDQGELFHKLQTQVLEALKGENLGNPPIQTIIYRRSERNGEEITGEKLKKQPFLWNELYQQSSYSHDGCYKEERCKKEVLCILLFTEILRKDPEQLSIEEKGLIVHAIRAIIKEDVKNPFYNAIFFLAVIYNGSRDKEVPIIFFTSETVCPRVTKLCHHLFELANLKYQTNEYIDGLTDQQKVIYYNMCGFLELYQLQSGDIPVGDFDYETMSVVSALSGQSNKTATSIYSNYTYRSSGSQNSNSIYSSRSTASSLKIVDKGIEVFWTQLLARIEPLSKREVKFILKGFSAACEVFADDSNKEVPYNLLNQAFEWLSEHSLAQKAQVPRWGTTFKSKKDPKLNDVPSESWAGLIKYLAQAGNEQAFARYCQYLVNSASNLKTYERDFVIQNIKNLYKVCYNEELWFQVLNLVGGTLAARLTELEYKKDLTVKDVEPYKKMLTTADKVMIDFSLNQGDGATNNQYSISMRVNELYDKAQSNEKLISSKKFKR